jgi:hypothetical protein
MSLVGEACQNYFRMADNTSGTRNHFALSAATNPTLQVSSPMISRIRQFAEWRLPRSI